MCYHLFTCRHLPFAWFVIMWLLVALQPFDVLSGVHVASCCATLLFALAGCSITSHCIASASWRTRYQVLMRRRLTLRARCIFPPIIVWLVFIGGVCCAVVVVIVLTWSARATVMLKCPCCLPEWEGVVTVGCKEDRARAHQQIFNVLCWCLSQANNPTLCLLDLTRLRKKRCMYFDNWEIIRLRGLEMKYCGACFEIAIWAQEQF